MPTHLAPPHALILLLTACAHQAPPSPTELLEHATERGGTLTSPDPFGDDATKIVYLDQGWNIPETLWWYHADQGSMLMSYDVLQHLEQPDKQASILDPAYLARFRFLTQERGPGNPDGLPIGFSRHQDSVGLTCAACHTGQIVYQGTAIRMDGAPTMADAAGYLHAIHDALAATASDPEKRARFEAAWGGKDGAEKADAALEANLAWFKSYVASNQAPSEEGYARLDAVGRIVNQAIRFTSGPSKSIPLTAPASYPVLWDAPRHDYVQWCAFAPNAGAGSLGRNTGEVLGVFGHVDVVHQYTVEEAKKGFQSSVASEDLVRMEESLRGLESPLWPSDILPAIDQARANRGAEIYKEQCTSCHALLDRADPQRKVTAMVTGIDVVGTDPNEALIVADGRLPSGILEGGISARGEVIDAELPALGLLGNVGAGMIAGHAPAALQAIANAKLHGIEESPKQGQHASPTDADPNADLRAYKARPLNGVWASAPYLHNGAVPTLYDLLLPPDQRPATFHVGRTTFDPKKVGYVTDSGPFVLDTHQSGNSNAGHTFGTTLSDEDRWALVEYLKTL